MQLTDQIREILKRARSRVTALGDEYESSGWRNHHHDLERFLLNRRGKYLSQRDYEPNDGSKINSSINNSTPEEAIHVAGAGLMGGFTNPLVPWLQLIPLDEDLRDYKPALEYLWRVQAAMYEVLSASNWYLVLPQIYEEMIAFGVGAQRLDLHPARTLHCTQYTVGSFYLANGSDGMPDTVAYRYPRTVRDLVRRYGLDGVSQKTRDSYEKPQPELDRWVKCVNLIEFNEGRDRKFMDWRGMKFRAITYEEEAGEEEAPLKMGGHSRFPVVIPRTNRRAEEVLGSSRGARALPDARQLQTEEKRASEALAKEVNPAMNIPANLKRADLRQGGHNRYRGQRSDAIRRTFDMDFPYGKVQDTIARREGKLKDVLGATPFQQFKLLDATGNHHMTIPEVQARRNEEMVLLISTQQSIHQELLTPAIELVYDYMVLNGKLEDAPPDLSDMPLKIQFKSQIGLEQMAAIISNMQAFAAMAAELEENGYVGARDKIDVDVLIDESAPGYLLPPKMMRDEDQVEEIRAQRAEDLRVQREQDQQELDAKTARDLGAAPLGDGNALEALTGGGP